MRFLVDLCHPGHVHFFRPVLARLESEGHQVLVTARDKDVTVDLLREFLIPHRVLSRIGSSRAALYLEFGRRLLALRREIRRFQPQLLAAIGGIFLAPLGRLTRTPSLIFTDTEHAATDRYLTYPWATRICTPMVFRKQIGPCQLRYHGFHELAYLHPRRFRPDQEVRRELGLGPAEPFSILRLVSWRAAHDQGEKGLSQQLRVEALRLLSQHGRVFLSTEGELPPEWNAYRIPVKVHRMHHALALADLYLGEGATMATEAALLGTPAIYVSSLVGTMGNFEALREAGLVLSYRNGAEALQQAARLLADPTAKAGWQTRALAFADGHLDVADFTYRQMMELAARSSSAKS